MSTMQTLNVGCYRLASTVSLRQTENGGVVALCDYPLRLVPLNPTLARLLSLCTEERTCEQLATSMHVPLKRIEALCDQLRWKSLLEAGPVAPPTAWPPISIVIPSYNRASELERCLHALFLLEYPHHCIEILVINDASTDNTSAILHKLASESKRHSIHLRSIQHTQRQGVAISRNTGAEAATYDLVAYIDSDCIASPTWLTELVPFFQDQRIAAVGGMVRSYECRSMLGRYEDVCSSLYMGVRPQRVCLEGPLTYLPTANFIVRRSIWQHLGGFAPLSQGEDVDFCRRVLLSGAHIRYMPQGVVYHDYRTTLTSFLNIRAAYASAEAALLQRHPSERRVLVLPPEQATFAGLVIGGLWGMFCALLISKKHLVGVEHDEVEHDRGKPCHYYTRTPVTLPRIGGSIVVTGLAPVMLLGSLVAAVVTTLFSTQRRLQKIRKQHILICPVIVLKATLRGNLAYTYHLCRHLTRYYTLPFLLLGLLFFPFAILIAVMMCIVISVDYSRLKPSMNLVEYALCAILNDCAYEVGVVQGCIRYKTWKPLIPILKKRV